MTTTTTRAVCYAIVTVLSFLCLIYYLVRAFENAQMYWVTYLTRFYFFFVLGSIFYSGYMTFINLKASGQPLLSENLVNENNTVWMKDVFFKYLISFGIGLAISWVIFIISIRFSFFSYLEEWVEFYSMYILPVLLILDAKYFDHKRCPQLSKDIIVFLCILAIHLVYSLLCNIIHLGFSNGFKTYNLIASSDLNLFVYTFCGYIAYDWILFRKTSDQDYFFRN